MGPYMELPYDPAILLLGVYPREFKTGLQIKTCIGMFIAVLFITMKNGNNPNVHNVMIG